MTDMTHAIAPTARLRDRLAALSPKRGSWDFLGFAAGFRAWQIYSDLAAHSDEQLRDLGLTRSDLPGVAMQAARD